MKLGDLSSTQGSKDNLGESSEEEHSEETTKEVKKPRLGGSSESQENNDKLEILEELADEKVGDKDQTKGLKEEDNLLRILRDTHEEVPLEDPGPKIAIEDGGNGVAGETQ